MLAVIFVLAVYFIVRPAIRFTYNYFRSRGEVADSSLFAMLLFVMLFLCAFTAQVIGKWVRYQYANSVPNCNLSRNPQFHWGFYGWAGGPERGSFAKQAGS